MAELGQSAAPRDDGKVWCWNCELWLFPGTAGHFMDCASAYVPTPERHQDGPDQREADRPDPNVNTFDPAAEGVGRRRR